VPPSATLERLDGRWNPGLRLAPALPEQPARPLRAVDLEQASVVVAAREELPVRRDKAGEKGAAVDGAGAVVQRLAREKMLQPAALARREAGGQRLAALRGAEPQRQLDSGRRRLLRRRTAVERAAHAAEVGELVCREGRQYEREHVEGKIEEQPGRCSSRRRSGCRSSRRPWCSSRRRWCSRRRSWRRWCS